MPPVTALNKSWEGIWMQAAASRAHTLFSPRLQNLGTTRAACCSRPGPAYVPSQPPGQANQASAPGKGPVRGHATSHKPACPQAPRSPWLQSNGAPVLGQPPSPGPWPLVPVLKATWRKMRAPLARGLSPKATCPSFIWLGSPNTGRALGCTEGQAGHRFF